MKISIFSLLSLALCGLVTSCYPPLPPEDYVPTSQKPITKAAPKNKTMINDRAQKELEQARENLNNDLPSSNDLPSIDNTMSNTPSVPSTPTKYPYATKVPGKQGFVFNPYTKNQVDVRGIPNGTLVRDPYDSDKTHKFRVP